MASRNRKSHLSCPICGRKVTNLVCQTDTGLTSAFTRAVRLELPNWIPQKGACRQCLTRLRPRPRKSGALRRLFSTTRRRFESIQGPAMGTSLHYYRAEGRPSML